MIAGSTQNEHPTTENNLDLKARVKEDLIEQRIGNTDYGYSLLPKKRANFFGENERLLVSKGITSIGYARGLPNNTLLPFPSV